MPRPQDFVKTRLYDSEGDVIQDSLRHLLRARPDCASSWLYIAIERKDFPWRRPPALLVLAGLR